MKVPPWLSRDLLRIALLLTSLLAVLLLRQDCAGRVGDLFRSMDEVASRDASLDRSR